jgi:hypothetical protein
MPYTYRRESDGTDETFDIRTPDGELLTSVPFWDAGEQAEANAQLIVDALNAYKPSLFETVKVIVTRFDKELIVNKNLLHEATEMLEMWGRCDARPLL